MSLLGTYALVFKPHTRDADSVVLTLLFKPPSTSHTSLLLWYSLLVRYGNFYQMWQGPNKEYNSENQIMILKMKSLPWLAWLSWLGVVPQTKWWPVRFPVRAHAWVEGSVLCLWLGRLQKATSRYFFLMSVFLFPSISLPSPLFKKE